MIVVKDERGLSVPHIGLPMRITFQVLMTSMFRHPKFDVLDFVPATLSRA